MAATNAMADFDAPQPEDNHTELEETIKIRLSTTTDANSSLCTQFEILGGTDPDEWPDNHRDCGGPSVAHRQKTNIVLYTHEECESLLTALSFANAKSKRSGEALDRVGSELDMALLRQGLTIEDDDRIGHYPTVEEIPGAIGKLDEEPVYQPDDLVSVTHDGETDTLEVLEVGPEKALLKRKVGINWYKHGWVSYEAIDSLDHEAMEERARERNQVPPRDKRMQADHDALLDLCKRHAAEKADEVWGSTIDVESIEFEFNARFSYLGGRYKQKRRIDGPKIELSPGLYYTHGLDALLDVVRHEMIHAWQDFHPNGHPSDTHKHHGRDFYQWLDDMDTGRFCKSY